MREVKQMELSERKKQILQAIVDDYIETAEPIGSRTIVRRHDISLSPATIRNEMADLEDMGFLEKPHTSAGRIPSKMGYRFYVNSLMQRSRLSREETEKLKAALEKRMGEMDALIAEASSIVSRLTAYTVIAAAPRAKNLTIKSIKLLPLGGNNLLLSVINSIGILKNAGIELSKVPEDAFVYAYSKLLSEALCGKSPHDLSEEQLSEIQKKAAGCPELYKKVISFLFEWFEQSSRSGIYADGVVNIFNHPEYNDIERAKKFIGFLDDKDNILGLLQSGDKKLDIKIGDENGREELSDCSVVTANYDIGDSLRGSIGVLGPMRMDYARVISSLEVITERLNFLIYKMFFNE